MGIDRAAIDSALETAEVIDAATALDVAPDDLGTILRFGYAFARAVGDEVTVACLGPELNGYQESEVSVPEERKVLGFASAFPVRALEAGFLEPEDIFIANREKFTQVTLTIGQAVEELESAIGAVKQGGVLVLQVPASEVSGGSAAMDPDTMIFIYVLPREVERILTRAKTLAHQAVIAPLARALASR